jgi:hypothetical protein
LLRLRNDSQQQDLRYDPHTDWVRLIDEGETLGKPLERSANSTNDIKIAASQETPLPAMVQEPAGVHDHEDPLIEQRRDDDVRAGRDDLGDLALPNEIAPPTQPAENVAHPPSAARTDALTNEDIKKKHPINLTPRNSFSPCAKRLPREWLTIS